MNNSNGAWYQLILSQLALSIQQCHKEGTLCEYLFFEIEKGKIKTKILRGKKKAVYLDVSLGVIDDLLCSQIIEDISMQPLLKTNFLSGQLPETIEAIFEKHQVRLFPVDIKDFVIKVTGADERSKHLYIACLMNRIFIEFNKNPYLFFQIRGFNIEAIKNCLKSTKEVYLDRDENKDSRANFEGFWGRSDVEGISKKIDYSGKVLLDDIYLKLPFLSMNQENLEKIYHFLKK